MAIQRNMRHVCTVKWTVGRSKEMKFDLWNAYNLPGTVLGAMPYSHVILNCNPMKAIVFLFFTDEETKPEEI